ncbi:hypothetical protein SEA_CONLEY_65 [Gordonia phage Conley]|nr:hypothetical protein SEA_CONLEY_65 [Gordonia phage Conley]
MSELDKSMSHHPAGSKQRHIPEMEMPEEIPTLNNTKIPTLENIRQRRLNVANQKQVILARQAVARKMYKILSQRLDICSEQEALLDEMERTVIKINAIKERHGGV